MAEHEFAVLSHEEARRFYDRLGKGQDSQAFYEDVATRQILEHGEFASATAVFELGCGTGRLAETLLRDWLPADAAYRALELSPEMARLAEARLAAFGERASVTLSDGSPPSLERNGRCDRFVSSYVLDLLSEDEIGAVLASAHAMLTPAGLLCLCSLSSGHTALSKLVIGVWSRLHRLRPRLVGGCRPIEIAPRLAATQWRIEHHGRVAPFGIPSEVVVARRL